jgi:hypothetical protein
MCVRPLVTQGFLDDAAAGRVAGLLLMAVRHHREKHRGFRRVIAEVRVQDDIKFAIGETQRHIVLGFAGIRRKPI